MKQVRVTVRVKGRVQGVFYRQSTLEQAQQLGINGWVRNLPDGDVEAVFEGTEQAVEQMLAWCRQGPSAARVDDIIISREAPTGAESGFRVR